MNQTDPLANLRDIHLPAEVSWWPLAPLWWIVIFSVVAALIWLIYRWLQHRKRQLFIKQIDAELVAIQASFEQHQTERKLVSDYSQLLRRLHITHQGREQAANISGEDWMRQLAEYLPDQQPIRDYQNLLIEGKYQRHLVIPDRDAFVTWVSACAKAIGQQIVQEKAHA